MSGVIQSLHGQLAELEENLRLVQEQKSKYVQETDIPLQLTKDERRIEAEITDLRERLAWLAETACPYRGLEPFEAEHAEFFFGREAMVESLVAKVGKVCFVAVVGPSGCGKSSLVRAGLVTALYGGALSGSQEWAIRIFRPGREPLRALAVPLVTLLEPESSEVDRLAEARKLADHLQNEALSMDDVVAHLREVHPGLPHLVLVADQFEELYTECDDKAVRRAFVKALLAVAETEWVTVVLTLRADFYGRVLEDRTLGKQVSNGLVSVLPMSEAERRAAIEGPALATGRTFEAGLVERVLGDVGDEPGNLPLLEFALTLLWERQTDGQMTHVAYDAIGGVEGALARYADETYNRLNTVEQEGARRVLVQMVLPGEEVTDDLPRSTSRAEVGAEDWGLIQKLADTRLVVTQRDPTGQEVAEVVHDALIRVWMQLRSWVDADRDFRSWQERLRAAVHQWKTSNRDAGAVLHGVLLVEALRWWGERRNDLGADERVFIETSAARVRRVRHLKMGAVATAIVLVLLALAVTVIEQVGVFAPHWISTNGPYGGAANFITVHPQQSDTIYVGTIGRGVFKSEDGGQTWYARNVGLTNLTVHDIQLDPFNASVLYCATKAGIFRSRDSGQNWADISDGVLVSSIRSIALDPNQQDLVYIGTWGAGVYMTEDAGEHWSQSSDGLASLVAEDISIDPLHSSRVYVATPQGVFGSKNGGQTWQYLGPVQADVRIVAVDSTNTNVLYAGVWGQGVFRSDDGGQTWALASEGLTDKRVRSIFLTVPGTEEIYVGTFKGDLFRSRDGARHWSRVTGGLGIARSIANDPRDPRVLFLATNNGLFKSTDGGQAWSRTGLYGLAVRALARAGSEPTTLFAGTEHGVFRLADDDQWLSANEGLRAVNVQRIFASENAPEIAYVIVGDGELYRRDSETQTWVPFGPDAPSLATLAIDSTDPDHVLVASSTGQLLLTLNGGGTWNQVENTPSLPRCVAFDGTDPPVIYIGTDNHGVFRSTDYGTTWDAINIGISDPTIVALAVDSTAPDLVYAATGIGVSKTTDGGETWHTVGGNVFNTDIHSIALGADGQTVWVVTGRGIFRSDDGGVSWRLVDRGLPVSSPYVLSIGKGEPADVYVGTQEGVYRLRYWWDALFNPD